MRRRAFVRNLACGLLALPLATYAQSANKVYRVVSCERATFRYQRTAGTPCRNSAGSRARMSLSSHVTRKPADQLPALAKELAELNVDHDHRRRISSYPSRHNCATKAIPIVFADRCRSSATGVRQCQSRQARRRTSRDSRLDPMKTSNCKSSRRLYYRAYRVLPTLLAGKSLASHACRFSCKRPRGPGKSRLRGPADLESFSGTVRARPPTPHRVSPSVAWMGPHGERIASEAIKARVPLLGTWRSFCDAGRADCLRSQGVAYWRRHAASSRQDLQRRERRPIFRRATYEVRG